MARPSRYGPRGDRTIARDRPSRYETRERFPTPSDREGQALALRAPGTTSYADATRGTGPRATGPGDDFLRRCDREGQAPRATEPGDDCLRRKRSSTGYAEIERSRGTGPRATEPGDDFLRRYNARDRPSRYETRKRLKRENDLGWITHS